MATRIWAQKNSTQWVHLHHHLYCQYRRQKIPQLTQISYIIYSSSIINHMSISYIRSCSLGAIQGVSRMVLSPSLLATWSSELNWTRSNSELFGNIKFWFFWQHQILNFFWQHQILNFLATWSSEKSSSSSLIILSVALSHKKLDPNCNSEHWVIESWPTQFRFFVIFEGATYIWIRYYQRNYVFSKLTPQ